MSLQVKNVFLLLLCVCKLALKITQMPFATLTVQQKGASFLSYDLQINENLLSGTAAR
jgi:hypothetical protein